MGLTTRNGTLDPPTRIIQRRPTMFVPPPIHKHLASLGLTLSGERSTPRARRQPTDRSQARLQARRAGRSLPAVDYRVPAPPTPAAVSPGSRPDPTATCGSPRTRATTSVRSTRPPMPSPNSPSLLQAVPSRNHNGTRRQPLVHRAIRRQDRPDQSDHARHRRVPPPFGGRRAHGDHSRT